MDYFRELFLKYKITYAVLLMSILILGIAVRFIDLNKQFTHIDDIGVAWSILVQVDDIYNSDYVRDKINDSSHIAYNTPQYKLLRWFERKGKIETLLPYFKGIMKFVIIPQSWTYAPFQFLFTPLLISSEQDYQSLLFWGRFPSFIFSSLALIIMVYIFMQLNGQAVFLSAVAALLIFGFSWENIIYARHMSSYAIGVFAAVLLLYVFIKVINTKEISILQSILIGFILAIITNMQYQIFYFLPAFFGAWLLSRFKIKEVIFTFISFVVFILPSLVMFILPKAHLSSQMFSDTIYNFKIPPGYGLWDIINYSIWFFIGNSYSVFQFITTYLPFDNTYLNVATSIIIILAIFGFIRLFFSANGIYRRMGIFFTISIITILFLILTEKISFSPTRHSLIYLPYITFLVAFGIGEIYNFVQRKLRFRFDFIMALFLTTIILLPFFANYQKVAAERKDPFNEKTIGGLISQYNPRYIIASDMNLFFMKPLKGWDKYSGGNRLYNVFIGSEEYNDKIYMLVSQIDLDNNSCSKMLKEVNDSKFNCEADDYQIIYEYHFDNDSTLDIAREAHVIYNKLSIKIIKF